jgi:hypothetical protein
MNSDITKGSGQAVDLSDLGLMDEQPQDLRAEPAVTPQAKPEVESMPGGGPSPPDSGKQPFMSMRRMVGFVLIVVALGVGVFVFASAQDKKPAPPSSMLSQLPTAQSIPLTGLSQSLVSSQAAATRQLTVNGQLNVTDTIVLTPTAQPTTPVAGQLYYDQTRNVLAYYNGKGFVNLQGGGNTSITNNNVTNKAGNVANVTNLTDVTNDVTNVTNPGGGVAAVNGTAGDLAYFTDPTTLGSSLVNESGSTITVNGSTVLAGTTVVGQVNSGSAFAVKNNSGIAVMGVDTTNNYAYLSPIANATVGTQTDNSIGLELQSNYWNGSASANENFTIKNIASTSAPNESLAIQNNAGVTVASLSGTGAALFHNSADSTTAFQIQNAAGTNNLLTADTTNNQITLGTNTNLVLQGPTAYISNDQGWTASESFGEGATVSDYLATAIGNDAQAGYEATAIGQGATATNNGGSSVAIGYSSNAFDQGVAIGTGATTTSWFAEAIGDGGTTAGLQGIALGFAATAADNSIAIGASADASTTHSLVFGGSDAADGWLRDAYFGSGITDAVPHSITIHATGGSGSNVAGADLSLAGGIGTGNASGGTINLQVAQPGVSSSNANPLATVASISGVNGAAKFQNASDSTTAFQIQNAAATATIFTADTTNQRIDVGTTGTSTAQLYVSGQLPTNPVGTEGNSIFYYGQMAVQNGYAYSAEYGSDKMDVIDVTDPTNPTPISHVDTGIGSPLTTVAQGKYAYLVDSGSSFPNFAIMDISNPAAPQIEKDFTVPNDDNAGPLVVQGRYAYFEFESPSNDYISVIDISNPTNPSIVSTTQITTGLAAVYGLLVSGDYMYVDFHDTTGTGLAIYDVNNPGAPSSVGTMPIGTTSAGLYQPMTMAIKDRYLYVANDNGSPSTGSVIDISNPASPLEAGRYNIGDSGSSRSVIEGNRLYTLNATHAMIAADDISSPTSPTYIGFMNGANNNMGLSVVGRYLYTTGYNVNPSLMIYDLGGTYSQQVEAGDTQTGSLNVTGDTTLGGNLAAAGSITANGLYVEQNAAVAGDAAIDGNTTLNGTFFQKTSTNSTTAFQVQDASANSVFDIDTTNDRVGVGTNAPTGRLTVHGVDTTSSNDAFDVTDAAGTNLVEARDDGLVGLGEGTNAAFGNYDTGTPDTGDNYSGLMVGSKFTTGSVAPTISSMSVYVNGPIETSPNDQFQLGIYTDSGGSPNAWVASSTATSLTGNAWNTVPVSATLAPNTNYWLVYTSNVSTSGDNTLDVDSTSQPTYMYSSFTFGSGPHSGMPNTISAGGITNHIISVYATTTNVSTPAFTVGTNGSVGIGIGNSTAPTANLQIVTPTDTTTAFQIQNQANVALLTADTTNMMVTVTALVVSTNLTVNGHIITGGSAPGIAAGAAACTSPTVSVVGDDTSGTVTVTTGSGCAGGGTLATITFANAYAAAPRVILTPGSPISQTLGAYVDDSTVSPAKFDLGTNTTPSDATTYKWNYWVAQ